MQIERDFCIIPKRKWNSITHWLTEKKLEEERLQREKAYLKYMKETSTALVAGRASKKEAAAKRLDDKKIQAKIKEDLITRDYLRIRDNQKMEREEIMKKYKRQTIINETPTLELTRALREAQVLHEREKELEFRKVLREKEKEMKEKERNEMKRQWEALDMFHMKKDKYRKCKLNEVKAEVFRQCQQNKKKMNEELTNQINQEKMDLSRMAEELENKEKIKKEQQLSNKRKSLSLLKKAAENAQNQRYSEKKQDQELYKVNEVISNAINRRNCLIKSSLQKETRDRVDQHVDSYVKYFSQLPAVEPSEEAIYLNGVRQNREEYNRKIEEKQSKQKKFSEDKIQNYKDDMMRQKMKEEEEAELKRIEMIERYKKAEAMKHLDKINKEEEMKQKKTYGKDLLNQTEEQMNIKKHEKKLEDEYVFYSFSKQDDHFAEYADEVIEFAKEKNWPTVPIKKVIENYKKKQPLIQRKRKETPCGPKHVLLTFEEEYMNIPPEVKKKFDDLNTKVRP